MNFILQYILLPSVFLNLSVPVYSVMVSCYPEGECTARDGEADCGPAAHLPVSIFCHGFLLSRGRMHSERWRGGLWPSCSPACLYILSWFLVVQRENAQREMERRIVAQLLTCLSVYSVMVSCCSEGECTARDGEKDCGPAAHLPVSIFCHGFLLSRGRMHSERWREGLWPSCSPAWMSWERERIRYRAT